MANTPEQVRALDRATRVLEAVELLEELRRSGVEVRITARPDRADGYRVVINGAVSRVGEGDTLADAVMKAAGA